MTLSISKISRPNTSRLAGVSILFLFLLILPSLIWREENMLSGIPSLSSVVRYVILAIALSFHYTVVPLKYNLKLFLCIGAGMGVIVPQLLGGYAVFLIIFTIPIFGLIATLGPKLQDSLDRYSKNIHYILIAPFLLIIAASIFDAIRYLVVNGYFAI